MDAKSIQTKILWCPTRKKFCTPKKEKNVPFETKQRFRLKFRGGLRENNPTPARSDCVKMAFNARGGKLVLVVAACFLFLSPSTASDADGFLFFSFLFFSFLFFSFLFLFRLHFSQPCTRSTTPHKDGTGRPTRIGFFFLFSLFACVCSSHLFF